MDILKLINEKELNEPVGRVHNSFNNNWPLSLARALSSSSRFSVYNLVMIFFCIADKDTIMQLQQKHNSIYPQPKRWIYVLSY